MVTRADGAPVTQSPPMVSPPDPSVPATAGGRAASAADRRPPIHPSNPWNPTGLPLLPVPGCRLYYAYHEGIFGQRTFVFLGSPRHLTFVADFEGAVPPTELRERMIREYGIYPHQLDIAPAPGLPRTHHEEEAQQT